jgi:hypothetical protein
MRYGCLIVAASLMPLVVGGCPLQSSQAVNPFITYADEYGIGQQPTNAGQSGAAGVGGGDVFRKEMTLTFTNKNAAAIVESSFVAWVEVSSIRSASQQEALLRGGYKQLSQTVQLGTAYTLPPGTFVYNGAGTAGATRVLLDPGAGDPNAQGGAVTGTSVEFTLITPDKILVTLQPPVSCDSAAFAFIDPLSGEILAGASTLSGGYKTLAQVDVYECSPLRPGVFLNTAGGAMQPNQYREGDPVAFSFNATADANGAFATVVVGAQADPNNPG